MPDRIRGFLMILLGLGLGYFCVLWPLEQTGQRNDHIILFIKGVFVVPLCLIFGPIYMVLGEERLENALGTQGHRKPLFWIFGIVAFAASFGVYFWLKSRLADAGYQ